ncbi:MAG: hypothetical protein Marn2KO_09740 [Marinobacter nauticus]
MSRWRLLPSVFRSLRVGLVFLSALVMSACGGSSGSSSDGGGASTTASVVGTVTDPAIEGAAVRLVDAQGEALTRIQITDQTGQFSFQLSSSVDLAGARVVAVGGRDVETGQDLQGIMLEARLRTGSEIMVTPLTTLALAYEREGGTLAGFASMLGLTEQELESDPANSAATQRASMLLTELTVAMKGAADSTSSLLGKLQMANGNLRDTADLLVADAGLPAAVVSRLRAVQSRITALDSLAEAPANAEAMVRELNRLNIRTGVADYLSNNLDFQPASDSEHANLNALADAIFEALNQRGLPADSAALLNIARYVVVINALSAEAMAAADFTVPQPIDPENLLPLLADTEVVDSTLPLAVGEELGDDNAARVEYFFRSDLSPYYRAARLFDGVMDDQVTDPVYVSVVRGLADAGFIEQAELMAQSSVFQSSWKGEAFQEAGRALEGQGKIEDAIEAWDKALELYNRYLKVLEDENGVPLVNADDASFYQTLSDDYRDAGYPQKADEAMAGVRAYIKSQKGQPYNTAYGRLAVGVGNNAEALVLEAIGNGSVGESYDRAREAASFFLEVVSSMGARESADKCYAIKTLQLASVAEFYGLLGEYEKLEKTLDEFEALLDIGCNQASVIYAKNYADAYGLLGLDERFKSLLEEKVRPYDVANDKAYEADALAAFSVYEALELAKSDQSNKLEDAVALITGRTDDLADVVELLTYTGTGRDDGGFRYLSRRLWDEGYAEEALAIADVAFEITLSPEFAASETRPSSYIGQGCRKVAKLYDWFGEPAKARIRMDECSAAVEARMASWTTVQQADAYALLAESYQFISEYAQSLIYVPSWNALIDVMGDKADQAYQKTQIAVFAANAGDFALATRAMDEAMNLAAAIAAETDSQSQIEDGIEEHLDVAAYQQQMLDIIRGRIAVEGIAVGEPEAAERTRIQLRTGLIGSNGASGVLPLIAAINDPEDREDYLRAVIGLLAGAQFFDDAERLAQEADYSTSRNARLALVAKGYASYDDYPGSTVARFDFEKDGLPDFFSPASTQQERDALAVSLDDDIDGDGIANASDATPYCSVCEL